jgi:predicted transglutaminase-like cysteine proteinase
MKFGWALALFLLVAQAPLAGAAFTNGAAARLGAEPWALAGASPAKVGQPGQFLTRNRLTALLRPVFSTENSRQRWEWGVLVRALRQQSAANQLRIVQRFFSQQRYEDDRLVYADDDHWATVGEFLTHGGDCEDFALAKMHALIAAGFPEDNLRLVIVEDRIQRSAHAILAARIGGTVFYLDNQRAAVVGERDLTHYRPMFALNKLAVWQFNGEGPMRSLPEVLVTTRTR